MQLREAFGLERALHFPVVLILDLLHTYFPRFSYRIVEDRELPKDNHAYTDVLNQVIVIKESVYDGACNGKGRDRMTIAHEIGHYLLVRAHGLQLQRDFSKRPMQTYEDPEWQADCFAGELLVPAHLVRGMGIDDVIKKCGVSRDAARVQLSKVGR
jgi:Zn-dependent peptidase ImmA (M78 family)